MQQSYIRANTAYVMFVILQLFRRREMLQLTCTLREKRFKRVSRCSILHRDVYVMTIVLLILIMFMCMMSRCRTVSVGSITLCETGYKPLQCAYDDSPNYV